MGIKKIIREELEGFKDSTEEDWEWAQNPSLNPFEYLLVDYEQVGVLVNNEHESKVTQGGLRGLGYSWQSNHTYKDVGGWQYHGSYPFYLWVAEDNMKVIMYGDARRELDEDEIIIDNPFV